MKQLKAAHTLSCFLTVEHFGEVFEGAKVSKTTMGKNKQVKCRICNKTMRSNNLTRHSRQHEKKNYLSPVNKQDVGLEKYLLEKTQEFKELLEKGKEVYEILGKGEVFEKALPKDMKEALNLYVMQGNNLIGENAELKPWQAELLEEIRNPTDRHIIWVVGKACGEGKTWFQKYLKSLFGTRRVVYGINIKANTPSICHVLSKQSLATADIFLFNLGKSKQKYDAVNYEVLEDLKDGAAFASKYNSQQLKIKTPNVVMVFSNEKPDTKQLAMDRWKLFYIENDSLVEKQVVKNGDYNNSIIPKRKKQNIEELTDEELEKLEHELCLDLCWRGYHVCNVKDEDNSLLGIDISHLRNSIYKDDVKNKYKCLACFYASEEMEDVNKHFMEKHRDTFRLPCSTCKKKFKTIKELKIHYAAKHFKKNIKKKRSVIIGPDYIDVNTY